MTCATLKHLSMLAIDERELGDTKSGLALIAVPSLLKYHSRARRQNILSSIHYSIGVPIGGTPGRGNAEVPFSSRAMESTFSLSSLNLSSAKRAGSLRGYPTINHWVFHRNEIKDLLNECQIETLDMGASGHHKCCASRSSCGTHGTAVNER